MYVKPKKLYQLMNVCIYKKLNTEQKWSKSKIDC